MIDEALGLRTGQCEEPKNCFGELSLVICQCHVSLKEGEALGSSALADGLDRLVDFTVRIVAVSDALAMQILFTN